MCVYVYVSLCNVWCVRGDAATERTSCWGLILGKGNVEPCRVEWGGGDRGCLVRIRSSPPPPRARRLATCQTHAQVQHVSKLREMSPLWELVQEGVDLSTIKWSQH